MPKTIGPNSPSVEIRGQRIAQDHRQQLHAAQYLSKITTENNDLRLSLPAQCSINPMSITCIPSPSPRSFTSHHRAFYAGTMFPSQKLLVASWTQHTVVIVVAGQCDVPARIIFKLSCSNRVSSLSYCW